VFVPNVSSKIICPLDPFRPNAGTPFNWTIHTVAEVHAVIVPIQGLLRLKGSIPSAIWGFAGKSAWGTSMRATGEEHVSGASIVLCRGILPTCFQNTCDMGRRLSGARGCHPLKGS